MPATVKLRSDTEIIAGFQAIWNELQDELFEREDVIEGMLVALLSRENAMLFGLPGMGKSMLCRMLCARFVGAEYFEILLDRQLGKEELFGQIDMALYDMTSKQGKGRWERDPEGTLLRAHIAFLDEAGKAGPTVLNTLLTALNERVGKVGQKPESIPLISAFGASNELLEPELSALFDRWLIRLWVKDIHQPGNFVKLLVNSATESQRTTGTTLTLAELEHATRTLVPAIKFPQAIADAIVALRVTLQQKGVNASPRRWGKSVHLLQASAFLNGRDTVTDDDLAILRHVLWETEEAIPVVEQEVLLVTSPLARIAIAVQDDIRTWTAQLEANRGESVQVKSNYANEVNFKIKEKTIEIAKAVKAANVIGRNPARLNGALSALLEMRYKTYLEGMDMDEDYARMQAQRRHDQAVEEAGVAT